jgi:hypothetical protein
LPSSLLERVDVQAIESVDAVTVLLRGLGAQLVGCLARHGLGDLVALDRSTVATKNICCRRIQAASVSSICSNTRAMKHGPDQGGQVTTSGQLPASGKVSADVAHTVPSVRSAVPGARSFLQYPCKASPVMADGYCISGLPY